MRINRYLFALLALAGSLMWAAEPAQADPINTRPVHTGNLGDLEDAFDSIATDGDYDIDLVNGQNPWAVFSPTSNGLAASSLVLEVVDPLPDNVIFGLYSYYDPNQRLFLFNTSATTVPPQILLQFKDLNNDGSIDARSGEPFNLPQDTEMGFGTRFGFYLTLDEGTNDERTIFSEDSLNNGLAQMLIYRSSDNEMVDLGIPGVQANYDFGHWYIASEFTPTSEANLKNNNDDINFTDFLVQFESITPTPEPTSLVMLGLGGIALAAVRRRRRK